MYCLYTAGSVVKDTEHKYSTVFMQKIWKKYRYFRPISRFPRKRYEMRP